MQPRASKLRHVSLCAPCCLQCLYDRNTKAWDPPSTVAIGIRDTAKDKPGVDYEIADVADGGVVEHRELGSPRLDPADELAVTLGPPAVDRLLSAPLTCPSRAARYNIYALFGNYDIALLKLDKDTIKKTHAIVDLASYVGERCLRLPQPRRL